MEYLFIVLSLACVIAAYIHVSLRERTYLNILTPSLAFQVPSSYLLELYHLWLFGPSASRFAYALIYACYAATFVVFALGYSRMKLPILRLPFAAPQGSGNRVTPYLVLGVAIALYLPVLWEFRNNLLNPREIYEKTRSGYGVSFFLSTTLCYLAFILLLFKRRLGRGELAIFTLICLVLLWLHGSKNQMLLMLFILTTHLIYVQEKRMALMRFVLFGGVLSLLGTLLFLITTPQLLLEYGSLEGIASYSDYTRNGMRVIDSDVGPLYGRLSLEQQMYSRVPRPLFPAKPNDFGALYLAEHFFPDAFQSDKGAPAFSFGIEFADFGVLALPILLVESLFGGMLLKMFMTGLRRNRDPGSFVLVLFAAGLSLLPLPGTFLLGESLVLAVAVNLLHSIRSNHRAAPALTTPLATAPDGSPAQLEQTPGN
jgi:hypothetical protein